MRLARRTNPPVFFAAVQHFRIIEDDRFEGEWRVRTDSYAYTASFSPEIWRQFFIGWHWHPQRRPGPHMHVNARNRLAGDLHTHHVPSGRVSFEEVVRYLIEEVRVRPRQANWADVIGDTERRFRAFRSWS